MVLSFPMLLIGATHFPHRVRAEFQCEAHLHLEDLDDFRCSNHEDLCEFNVLVSAAQMAAGDDACSEAVSGCAYTVDDGNNHGICSATRESLAGLCPSIFTSQDQVTCIAEALEVCEGRTYDECGDECAWLATCTVDDNFCESHCIEGITDTSKCGQVAYSCEKLQTASMPSCGNRHLSEILDVYCGEMTDMSKQIDVACLTGTIISAVALLVSVVAWPILKYLRGAERRSAFIVKMVEFFEDMINPRLKEMNAVLLRTCSAFLAFSNGVLLVGAVCWPLRGANDHADVGEWIIGEVEFSPHWLLFIIVFSLLYTLYYVAKEALKANRVVLVKEGDLVTTDESKGAKKRHLSALGLITIFEGWAWGSLIGCQSTTWAFWVLFLIAIIDLAAKRVIFTLWHQVPVLPSISTALAFFLAIWITFNFLYTPADLKVASAFLALASALQLFMSIQHLVLPIFAGRSTIGSLVDGFFTFLGATIASLIYVYGVALYDTKLNAILAKF